MAHNHDVIDTDAHYKIDGVLRTISNLTEVKRALVQGDHNSERLVFEMPRYIDGHDMSECNVVQIHYLNVDTAEKNKVEDVYNVRDLQVSEKDDQIVVFSWLVSGNCTRYAGSLNFIIRFCCFNDGDLEYSWNTTIFKGISILTGLDCSEGIVEEYSDIVADWENRIQNAIQNFVTNDFEIAGIRLGDADTMAGGITTYQLREALETYPVLMIHTDPTEYTLGYEGQLLIGGFYKNAPELYICTKVEFENPDDPLEGVIWRTWEKVGSVSGDFMDKILSKTYMPTFEEIDNTPFKSMIKACAENWYNAAANSGVSYQSLSDDDVDNMATSVNPMIYATRDENKQFTETYRDIWGEVKAGSTKSVNCITLANMIMMGIPYEQSRLNSHKNNIGAMGYAFDICKYIGSTRNVYTTLYNPNKELNIATFENILTQASFTETCSSLDLVRTVKTSQSSDDGDIWYDAIRPGDVLFNSTHTMFCLDVETIDGVLTIHYIDAGQNNAPSINYHTLTVADGVPSKTLVRVIRPYYNYVSPSLPNLMDYSHKKFKGLDGPYPGIGKNEDLNTYLSIGEFRCASDANAKSLANKPSLLDKAFKLTVENLLDDSTASTSVKFRYLKQTITTVYGHVYYRVLKCNLALTEILTANEWFEMAPNNLSNGIVSIVFNNAHAVGTSGGLANSYVIKNGICYGTLDFVATANLNDTIINNSVLPISPIDFCFGCFHTEETEGSKCGVLVINGGNIIAKGFQAGCRYMLSFSYPIA